MKDFDPAVTTEGTHADDALLAGDQPRVEEEVTILSGQDLERGAVLGIVSASGKWILSDDGAVDGSEVPRGVLAETADATGGDLEAVIYRTGEFAESEVTLGGAHTIASIREGCADLGIFFRAIVT